MMFTSGLFQRKRLITDQQEELLNELRGLIMRLRAAFERFGADTDPSDVRTLNDILEHLDELFLIVVAGEFNAGKSSFLNALLGTQVLPEGVTPTTDTITLLQYGEEVASELRTNGLRVHTYPADVLRQLNIVDTPGTNAVIRQHEQLTREFIPRADIVLFATSADRPFTESERNFLALIKEWGKKIVIILNKIDILSPPELEQVLHFIRENARDLLGITPDIFPVSAREALRSRSTGGEEGEALWANSRFSAVEEYVVDHLDEETRVRLKLLSPLGVAQRLSSKYLQATEGLLETLREDLVTIENIEQQMTLYREDLKNDVQYYLNEIDVILRDLVDRGDYFFEEHIRISRLRDLMRGDLLRAAFEREVVGNVSEQIDQKMHTLIDWMVEKNLRLQQSNDEYIKRRASQHSNKIIGSVGGNFDYNRRTMLETVGRAASEVVASYDKEIESQILADDVRASVAATALAEVGAVGLGTLLVALFHTALLDVTGIMAATLVAAGGFALLPAKRRQAKKALRDRVGELRQQLRSSVMAQFEREVERSINQVHERNAPFTRFVRAQRGQLSDLQQGFADIDAGLERLRKEIG
ncbi:Dynamin family protein [Oscillochloris trichoides DG-6]|uniref:Dynamin family protein n=1 Tax=Oscillochloris trichoides DG-6 TaxID=765420 RepID=E1IIJ3_9CHLR|nr:dynamin family protein [Oscillochloris trichoides]EFO78983.1 Dynamin family protein [Oscillochloris trichoides DG-6]